MRLLSWASVAFFALGAGPALAAEILEDVVISGAQTWAGRQVTVKGKLTIAAGGSLELRGSTLRFEPAVEDTTMIELRGDGRLKLSDSRLDSGSGVQWNLEGHDSCRVEFVRSRATMHTGIRARDRCTVSAESSDIEELQVHDSAQVSLSRGAAAYMALFLTGAGPVRFERGELQSGEGQTRAFDVRTSPSTTARVSLSEAELHGIQLDLVGQVDVKVRGGRGITLGMHLHDVDCGGVCRLTERITSETPRASRLDFSSAGGAAFEAVDTTVTNFNVYAGGKSRLDFSGDVQVIEANTYDQAVVTFGSKTKIYANLVQSYDDSEIALNGVTLLRDFYVPPSLSAMGRSILRINGVQALSGTQVYAIEQGQVHVTGGGNWSDEMFKEVGTTPPGGIYRH